MEHETHHFACECREKKVKKLLMVAKWALSTMKEENTSLKVELKKAIKAMEA